MDMPFDALNDVSDDALLVLFANGDKQAAQVLTYRLTPRVMAQAYRVLGSHAEAEEVTQDAMLRLWRIAPDWRQGEAKISTWLYRVVANLCIDRKRREQPMSLDIVAEPADGAASPAVQLQDKARAEALQVALQGLPERQRQAVVLRHIDGHDNPDIAEVMNISVEAVESLIARGKRALTVALQGKREELGYTDD